MNILHIICSPRPGSHSRHLSSAVVDRLIAGRPDARVTTRDLGRDPLPPVNHDFAESLSSPAALAAVVGTDIFDLSDQLIVELERADILVIGTPMNNFTVPVTLKAWIDQVVRIGRTFMPSPAGKVGLLKDRPVFIAIASGGFFLGDNARQPDFLTPYLTAILGCIGLTDIRFLSLQGAAFLEPDRLATQREELLRMVDAGATRSDLAA
ncbi:FMN-dependent NADH-azoreductase [Sphingomonas sp.]|uniref:FMN-dependent NADH-azoreductase n=1 Tax=Sphingomonas sp. TaxID=28214 RepID=UPI003D6D6287